jgi:acetate kinase
VRAPAPVLALNSGSSSIKFGLYIVRGRAIETLLAGEAQSVVSARSQADAVGHIATALRKQKLPLPAAIGHRVVHGGARLLSHCVIDKAVLRELHAATALAPLHVPPALAVIRAAMQRFPRCPHVACLDTAFHADLPAVSRTLPIAREMRSPEMRRYGFHGLSCESILRQLGRDKRARVVVAHLGNGASVTAVRGGKSIDTSMGLTPTGGVIMGTRPGDLDPGVLVYLARQKRFGPGRLEALLNRRSGLRGISELDSDMRRLHEAARRRPRARLAIEMFCYSVRREIAAMIASLGGLDTLVFTGGIGEHDAKARRAICAGLAWAGIEIDARRNLAGADPISGAASRSRVRVLRSEEEKQIARHAWKLTSNLSAPARSNGSEGVSREERTAPPGAAARRARGRP